MATRGHGGVQRWLLGSVADKVMRLSSRPVLLIRPPEPEDGAASLTAAVPLRRLMVPLDGSPLAEAALPLADSLGAALGASLLFVRVEPWLVTMMPDVGYVPNLAQMDADAEAAAQSYLDEVRGRLTPALQSASTVARGAPAETLIRLVAEDGIDLFVMSTQGRGGLSRLVLGSTADRVVRAGVPTLLVRA
jgi:nucleotide-binding universal stress UspA family protein